MCNNFLRSSAMCVGLAALACVGLGTTARDMAADATVHANIKVTSQAEAVDPDCIAYQGFHDGYYYTKSIRPQDAVQSWPPGHRLAKCGPVAVRKV
jgi:hypothetical protein